MEKCNKLDDDISKIAVFSSCFGKLITLAMFAGAILGTIFWRWYAIPISFGLGLLISSIFGRIFIDPNIRKISKN